MGGSACCSERQQNIRHTERLKELTKKEKVCFFKKVSQFNWNIKKKGVSKDHQNDITLLESIMISITNDLGMSSPHIAYTIYVEWIKFMVLNLMKVELEKEEGVFSEKFTIDGKETHVYTGFIAPPYVDQFWAKIYPTREYMAFCKEFFGGFLLRDPVNTSLTHLAKEYEKTLEGLKQTSDVVKYFRPLWPKLNKGRDLKNENKGFVSLTVPELYYAFKEINDFLNFGNLSPEDKQTNLESSPEDDEEGEENKEKETIENKPSRTLEDVNMLCNKIFEHLTSKHTGLKSPNRPNEGISQVKVKDVKRTLKKYLDCMKRRIRKIDDSWTKRLTKKFLLDYATAKRWIEEYFIYLALLSKDTSNENHAVPSRIILEVWKTHYEYFENYIEAIIPLFGSRHIFPDDFGDPYFHSKASKLRYSMTLLHYKELTGDDPEPEIWAPEDKMKENRCDLTKKINDKLSTPPNPKIPERFIFETFPPTQYTSVNIHRLCMARFMLKSEKIDYDQKQVNPDPKDDFAFEKNMKKRISKREEAKKDGKRYLWRVGFPHCKNIYADEEMKKVKDGKEIFFKEENNQIFEDQKEGNIFKEQGIVFVSDSYDRELYVKENYKKDLFRNVHKYWESKVKVTDIDNLCDSFFLRFDFEKYKF